MPSKVGGVGEDVGALVEVAVGMSVGKSKVGDGVVCCVGVGFEAAGGWRDAQPQRMRDKRHISITFEMTRKCTKECDENS